MTYLKRSLLRHAVAALALLALAGSVAPAQAQSKGNDSVEIKTSPKFMAAFKAAVAKPAESTVRVLCNGKETALGVVVAKDGFILTMASDLTGKITVKVGNDEWDAEWVGHHEEHDLAALKVDLRCLSPIPFPVRK